MIVLDANVLIAHVVQSDPHASRAFEILETDDDLLVHPLTLAESLIGPTRKGIEAVVAVAFERMGVERFVPREDEPLVLARLRAATGLKLPDCCVLSAATASGAALATFDARLAAVAREQGLTVLD